MESKILEELKAMYTELYEENKKLLQNRQLDVMTKEIRKDTYSEEYATGNRFVGILSKIGGYGLSIILLAFFCLLMIGVNESEMKNAFHVFEIFIVICGACIIFYGIYGFKVNVRESQKRKVAKIDYIKEKEEYTDLITERIFSPMIIRFFPYISYEHSKGISENIYNSMGFPIIHEIYKSTDYMMLNEDVELSKVCTQLGGVHIITLFKGIVSTQKFSFCVPLMIKIRNRNAESLKFKSPVLLENTLFNEFYELETDNDFLVNKFLDHDLVNYLVNLAQKGIKCEINIIQNNMYIRIEDREFLEFDIENNENDFQRIVNACEKINLIFDINEFMAKNLNK